MNESIRKKIIFVALGLAIIWGYYNIDKNNDVAKQDPQEQVLSGSKTTTIPEKLIDVETHQELAWGRNPFQEPDKLTPKTISHQTYWLLSGIVYSENNPMAIINNKSLFIGDNIDEARVVDISRKNVILDYKGKKLTLTVAKG